MHKYYKIFFTFIIGASTIALGLAYGLEYYYDLHPCQMCYYQRWVYFGLIISAISGIVLKIFKKAFSFIVVLLLFIGVATSFMHMASENNWVIMGTSCTSSNNLEATASLEQFRDLILSRDIIPCDTVQWSLFTISMAGWNFIYSSVIFAFSLIFAASFARNLHNVEETYKLK